MIVFEENWIESTISIDDSVILDAIQSLNNSGMKIALAVNKEMLLLGAVSDGDIRRALLKGVQLHDPLSIAIRSDPVTISKGDSLISILQSMQKNNIQQAPVVDGDGRLVGLYTWVQTRKYHTKQNYFVIMAGGRGSRLMPLTQDCPKPLLMVGEKPIVERIIERATTQGFKKYVVTLHYLGEMIKDYFGDGSERGISISYTAETKPLGTAGALGLIYPAPEEPFIVSNGDLISDIDYDAMLDFHIHQHADATMAVRVYEWQHPFGVVETSGINIVGFSEKPTMKSYINAGVYVLSPSVLQFLGHDEYCDMPSFFEKIKNQKKITIAYPIHESWTDVGRINDFSEAKEKYES